MKIVCENLDQFLDIVSGLVERGITFDARVESLTIILTGGH